MNKVLINLRKIDLNDAPRITDLLQDPRISQTTQHIPYPYTIDHAKAWIVSTEQSLDRFPYAIVADGQLVGCISHWSHPCGREIGYWLGTDYWNRGFTSAALTTLLTLPAFQKTVSVYAKVLKGNVASEKVLLKNGFQPIEAFIERVNQPHCNHFILRC